MPSLSSHHAQTIIKGLILGESGSGKTGALASLAEAGYSLRILDFDNGLDILYHQLKSSPEALSRVGYFTLTDTFSQIGGKPVPKKVRAFGTAMRKLDKWKEEGEEGPGEGSIESWGSDRILVIDSLSFMARAALRVVLQINGRLGEKPWQSDWGDAQAMLEGLLGLLYSDDVGCHVLVLTHIDYRERQTSDEAEAMRGLPMSIGKALGPTIPRYFNLMVQAKTKGTGTSARRIINTKSESFLELKAPGPVKQSYPIETGLRDLFKDLLGHDGPQVG